MVRWLRGTLLISMVGGLLVLIAPASHATAPQCGTTRPCARTSMGMAYDPGNNEIVLFGGSESVDGTQRLADTWTRDINGWHAESPAHWPCTRHSPRMVWDGTQIMMFGGNGGSDCSVPGNQPDTWLWDGSDWTQCTCSTHPTKREGEGLAYDSLHDNVVLFGGTGSCPTDATKCSDTWLWDGSAWSVCDPETDCATHPPARGSPAMEFHAHRELVILYGGKGTSLLDDTWSWDGDSWSEVLNLTDPSPRTGARMVYDPSHENLVMFGGCTGSCGTFESQVSTVTDDSYTLNGGDWTLWSNAAPDARCCAGMAYFADSFNRILVFGGADQNGVFDDLWRWNFTTKNWTCLESC
jgi:hypothetical protein